MTKQRIQHAERLYALLLNLYPTKFRQQFGDEMKYVFAESLRDAYEQDGKKGIAILWGWTVIDLFKSLFHEYLEDRKGENSMNTRIFTDLKSAVLISFLMVLPFMLLEAITTSGFATYGFPLAIFILMWLPAVVFFLILIPSVRTVRAGKLATTNLLLLTLGVVLMALIAWAWVELLIDQMPCFLGVPNCD